MLLHRRKQSALLSIQTLEKDIPIFPTMVVIWCFIAIVRKRQVFLYDVPNRRLLNLPGLNIGQSMQYEPDISADGRYIVYVSEQLGKTDIFVYDRLTLQAKNITNNFIGEVRNPSISGNGRFITFEGNRSGQWDLEIYDRGLGVDLSLPTPRQEDS